MKIDDSKEQRQERFDKKVKAVQRKIRRGNRVDSSGQQLIKKAQGHKDDATEHSGTDSTPS